MSEASAANWARHTRDSWRHTMRQGLLQPWRVIRGGPKVWGRMLGELRVMRAVYKLLLCGVQEYGVLRAVKVE